MDPAAPDATQFPGWPRTAGRSEMDGREPVAYLPALRFEEPGGAVVTVTRTDTGEVLYTVRPPGETFAPPIYDRAGRYEATVDPPGAAAVGGLPRAAAGR